MIRCTKPIQRELIGEKILALRTRRGWTQKELADRMVVCDRCIAHWETGRYMPSLVTAKKLADVFKISLDELTRGVA